MLDFRIILIFKLPLNKKGVQRGLFAATRTDSVEKPFMRNLIDLAGQEAGRLQKV